MGRKILLIDDSAMLRRIATSILHAQPGRYEVVSATRAAEGYALACVNGFELILLDYLIAGLEDVPLCRRLQADARTSRVPTVLMVGQGVRPPAFDGLPTNVVELLAKPFAPEQLSGVVNAVVNLGRRSSNLRDLRASLHLDAVAAVPEATSKPIFASHRTRPNGDERTQVDREPTEEPSNGDPASNGGGQLLLKGTTATHSLANVLRTVADAGHSGVLRLRPDEAGSTEMIFDDGRLVVVSTHDADTYAARAADALPAKVSPATLEESVTEQRANGTPFLLNLGTRGLLSKSSAVALLHRFGQRQFARLWSLHTKPHLRFEFQSLVALPQYAMRLEPIASPMDHWLLETTRLLRTEDIATTLRHEGTVGTPWFQADGEAIARRLELAEDERALLRLINGRTDLPALARALNLTPEAVYLAVYRFRCLDVLSYRPAPAVFVMTPRTNVRRVLPLAR